jgi:hypothetical protein
MVKGGKTKLKTGKRRIRWDRSDSSSVVGYRLYWAPVGEVSYNSEHVDLGDRTEVILPDEVPSLYGVCGEVALAITALNDSGNESDMLKFRVKIDSPNQRAVVGLLRSGEEGWEPPSGASLLVDDLHHLLIRNPSLQGPDQAGTRDYYLESHHVEETSI